MDQPRAFFPEAQRVLKATLSELIEISQPCPTHFCKVNFSGSIIDRTFSASPAHIFPRNFWQAGTWEDPQLMESRNESDHAPIFIRASPQDGGPKKNLPIDRAIFKHDKFKGFLEEAMRKAQWGS